MSLAKTAGQTMEYELTGSKTTSKGSGKRTAIKAAEQLSSGRLLWILVVRHKVGLLVLSNAIFILNAIAPYWFDTFKSVF